MPSAHNQSCEELDNFHILGSLAHPAVTTRHLAYSLSPLPALFLAQRPGIHCAHFARAHVDQCRCADTLESVIQAPQRQEFHCAQMRWGSGVGGVPSVSSCVSYAQSRARALWEGILQGSQLATFTVAVFFISSPSTECRPSGWHLNTHKTKHCS